MSVLQPKIYSTTEWGARPAKSVFDVVTPVNMVIHHMDWPNRAPISDPKAALAKAFSVAKSCQNAHMDGNKWSDTGQNFTVTIDGIILEGRHGSLANAQKGKNIQSAHAADPDTHVNDNMSYGTEHEGTFMTTPMNQNQWEATVKLHAWLSQQSGLDTSKIIGHRDTGCGTDCPGNWLEAQLDRLRGAVHAYKMGLMKQPLPIKPVAPSPPPAPTVGNIHVVVSHLQKTAQAYDTAGKLLWKIDMLTSGVNGGQSVTGGDTPFGTYLTTGQMTPTTDTDTVATKMAYGPPGTSFIWLQPQADVTARNEVGIGIHAGGTELGFDGSQQMNQPLVPTLGCLRVHAKDLVMLNNLVKSEHAKGFHLKITVGN